MKGSLIIVGFFVLGTICGVCHLLPFDIAETNISYYALCALMFSVGLSVGNDPQTLKNFRSLNPRLVFLPIMTTKIVKDAGMEILGAAFKELPDDLKKQLNLGYGLQVTGVSSGKMSDAGVRKGFIILKANDQPMRKVSDLEEVMKAAVKSPNQVLFLTGVFPSGKRGYFAVDLTQE